MANCPTPLQKKIRLLCILAIGNMRQLLKNQRGPIMGVNNFGDRSFHFTGRLGLRVKDTAVGAGDVGFDSRSG